MKSKFSSTTGIHRDCTNDKIYGISVQISLNYYNSMNIDKEIKSYAIVNYCIVEILSYYSTCESVNSS